VLLLALWESGDQPVSVTDRSTRFGFLPPQIVVAVGGLLLCHRRKGAPLFHDVSVTIVLASKGPFSLSVSDADE
jgi:hypothetical protein